MIKKALKGALGVSIGITIGLCILPRLIFSQLYNDTYPPIWKHALLCFAVGYGTAFIILLADYKLKSLNIFKKKKED